MSGSIMFDRRLLEVAFSEIETVRQSLPATTISALAHEVVKRVARNLYSSELADAGPSSKEIDTLCDALLSDDPGAAAAFIENARLAGSSYDTLCLKYLSGAARRLGDWWDEDKVPFINVTIAAGRIYAILRILRLQLSMGAQDLRRAAVFASLPGENHTLGITIATDLARDRGWDIELFTGLSHDELVERLEQRQPRLICLSASGKRMLPALTRLLVVLRISNPNSRILIAGQIAASGLSLVGLTGADAAATEFEDALIQMDRLLKLPTLVPIQLALQNTA